MVVLDTDIISLVQSGAGAAFARLSARLSATPELIFGTIVSVEEQFRGRIAVCRRAAGGHKYVAAAAYLRKTLDYYRDHPVLDFDARAAVEFDKLKSAPIRIGTNDLRIAAVCLANAALLVTRNLADFRRVPGLRAEDWAA